MQHREFEGTGYGTIEPLTLSEVKQAIKVDYDTEDTLIASYLTAARRYCEQYTQRAFVRKTYLVELDENDLVTEGTGVWAQKVLPLPFGPAEPGDVQSVQYQDSEYNWVEMEESDYHVEGLTFLSIRPKNFIHVSPQWGRRTRYRVLYDAGYHQLPDDLRKAVAMVVGDLYENRNNMVASANSQTSNVAAVVSYSARALMAPYRRMNIM